MSSAIDDNLIVVKDIPAAINNISNTGKQATNISNSTIDDNDSVTSASTYHSFVTDDNSTIDSNSSVYRSLAAQVDSVINGNPGVDNRPAVNKAPGTDGNANPTKLHPGTEDPPGGKKHAPRCPCTCDNSLGGRDLIVCIDGTSNQFGQKNTNVIELYRLLKKDDGDDEHREQLTWYNSGIGTYARPSWKSFKYWKQVIDNTIDLAIAWNFEAIAMGAYFWLSEQYQKGDRIFLFGFSRGAYQVRVLSAMIDKVGLIRKGNATQIPFAYELYADPKTGDANAPTSKVSKQPQSINTSDSKEDAITEPPELRRDSSPSQLRRLKIWLRRTLSKNRRKDGEIKIKNNLPNKSAGKHNDWLKNPFTKNKKGYSVTNGKDSIGVSVEKANPTTNEEPDKTMAEYFKETFSREVRVHFVGVWDTVSSVGIVRSKSLPGTTDGMDHVCYFRHALALDERRVKFLPEYVCGGDSKSEDPKDSANPEDLVHTKEVWFAGTHSDIGGGNVENTGINRSRYPLRWMVSEATRAGLRFSPFSRNLKKEEVIEVHESLRHVWYILEGLPIKRLSFKSSNGTTFIPHRGAPRQIRKGQKVHPSLLSKHHKYVPRATLEDGRTWTEVLEQKPAGATPDPLFEKDYYNTVHNLYTQFVEARSPVSKKALVDEMKAKALEVEVGREIAQFGAREIRPLLEKNQRMARPLIEWIEAVWEAIPEDALAKRYPHLQIEAAISQSLEKDDDPKLGKRLLQLLSDRCIRALITHMGTIISTAFSPDGHRIVSGSTDYTIRIWNALTGETVKGPLEGHTGHVWSTAFSPDGRHIVSGSFDGTIRIWDASTGEMVRAPLEGHKNWVMSVAFSPDGSRVVSGSADNAIRIWDALTGEIVGQPLDMHTAWVESVAFSPDGSRIVSGSKDQTIRIWDVSTGMTVVGPLKGHKEVCSVAFSPDGSRVASGSSDFTVRIWDALTGEILAGPLEGHTKTVYSVAFSPDGRHVVSGSFDGTIRIWNALAGESVGQSLKGHTDEVNSVAFSPDGKQIVSGSADTSVRIWSVDDL